MGLNPEEAYAPLRHFEPYMPFRDASQGECTFDLTPQHCVYAWWKANKNAFFDFETFDVQEYEFFEQVENGDLNIIIPGKYLAFSGPHRTARGLDGYPTLTPEDYVPIFQQYGVVSVVRLNKKMYDKNKFVQEGFDHHDLFFIDGTNPSQEIVDKFVQISETTEGMIAVHCKAGLGRTGTCMGAYMMKHYNMTAPETIAWIRLCRPGSVIGPQQNWLIGQEHHFFQEGIKYREEHGTELAYEAVPSNREK
jgi:cell division cycle 14